VTRHSGKRFRGEEQNFVSWARPRDQPTAVALLLCVGSPQRGRNRKAPDTLAVCQLRFGLTRPVALTGRGANPRSPDDLHRARRTTKVAERPGARMPTSGEAAAPDP
jgi:hypothetical protein